MKFEPEDSGTDNKNLLRSNKSPSKSKTVRKRRSWELKPKDKAEAMENIRSACYHCSKEPSDLPHWEQNKFEEVLSEHLKTEHDIKDEFYLEKEHIKEIKLRRVSQLYLYTLEQHLLALIWNLI